MVLIPNKPTSFCIRYLKMVSAHMGKSKLKPPQTVVDLHAWFPAETPEPPVEVSQGDDLGKYLALLAWICLTCNLLPMFLIA